MRSATKRWLCNKPASLPGMKSPILTRNWIISTSIWNGHPDSLLLTRKQTKTFIPFKFDMKKRRIALKLSLHHDTPLFSAIRRFLFLYSFVHFHILLSLCSPVCTLNYERFFSANNYLQMPPFFSFIQIFFIISYNYSLFYRFLHLFYQ